MIRIQLRFGLTKSTCAFCDFSLIKVSSLSASLGSSLRRGLRENPQPLVGREGCCCLKGDGSGKACVVRGALSEGRTSQFGAQVHLEFGWQLETVSEWLQQGNPKLFSKVWEPNVAL